MYRVCVLVLFIKCIYQISNNNLITMATIILDVGNCDYKQLYTSLKKVSGYKK